MIPFWSLLFAVLAVNIWGLYRLPNPALPDWEAVTPSALTPYLIHCSILLISTVVTYYFFNKNNIAKQKTIFEATVDSRQFNRILKISLSLQFIFLLIVLFFFGGWGVLSGSVYRGEWRSSMGLYGIFLTAVAKFLAPAFFIYSAIKFRKLRHSSWREGAGLFLMASLTFLIGMSLGAKVSAMHALLGGFLILIWQRKHAIKIWAAFVLLGFIMAIFGALQFDRTQNLQVALLYINKRLVYVQAEPMALVNKKIVEKNATFGYAPTLLTALGSPVVKLVTGSTRGTIEYARYDFSQAITLFTYPQSQPQILSGEYNVTATIFAEALVAFGLKFYWIFSILAGFIAGIVISAIRKFSLSKNDIYLTLSIHYFVFILLPWFNSGGIATLFHIVTIFGMLTTFAFVRTAERVKFHVRS